MFIIVGPQLVNSMRTAIPRLSAQTKTKIMRGSMPQKLQGFKVPGLPRNGEWPLPHRFEPLRCHVTEIAPVESWSMASCSTTHNDAIDLGDL